MVRVRYAARRRSPVDCVVVTKVGARSGKTTKLELEGLTLRAPENLHEAEQARK